MRQMTQNKIYDFIVIGCGISGLLAAKKLKEKSTSVLMLDKGRNFGGRMATRFFDGAKFDHGAQFFTARSPMFKEYVNQWISQGIVKIWYGDEEKKQPHPRYIAVNGMNSLPKHLGKTLEVKLSTEINNLDKKNKIWSVICKKGNQYKCNHVILTAPGPQTSDILKNSNIETPEKIKKYLDNISYERSLSIMLRLNKPSNIPKPGGLKMDHDILSWICDNQIKGISSVPALTIHTTSNYAKKTWDYPEKEKINDVTDIVNDLLKISVKSAQTQRWKFALPSNSPQIGSISDFDLQMTFAGDTFGGTRIEGAALSGLDAADQIINAN